MWTRVLYAAGLAVLLVGCPSTTTMQARPANYVPPTTSEMLASKCTSIERQGRLPELADEHQRWVRDCQQAFLGPADTETSKARLRLALAFNLDRDLQHSAYPVGWGDVEAASRPEVTAVSQLRQDGQALVLSARWQREVLNDRGGALALACKATQVAPELFEGQLLCGDYVMQVRQDVGAAVKRWQTAFPYATNRNEQCQVVERLAEQSLHPDEDMASISKAIVERCLHRSNERERRAEVREILELQEARDRLKQSAAAEAAAAASTAAAQSAEQVKAAGAK